jgi:hypothetical protein
VIVLTDAPFARYDSLTSVDPNLILLHPLAKDWRWELERDMPYKRFKTYILEYLHLDDRLESVELVYYLDIDVVVGQPLQDWFEHVESTYVLDEHGRYPSKIVFFEGNKQHPIQGGQIVLERNSSQACLERWRYHIDAHPEEHKDQSALALMVKEQEDNDDSTACHMTIMPQNPHLLFLSEKVMTRVMNTSQYNTLMHIKNTHHAKLIPDTKQKKFFTQLLMLSPEEVEVMGGKIRIRPNKKWSSIRSESDQHEQDKINRE